MRTSIDCSVWGRRGLSLFRVTITGDGLKLRIEGAVPVDAGFVKNEFVFAACKKEASECAIQQVRKKLEQQVAAGGVVLVDVRIAVDEVYRSMMFWKLLRQEGFIFFPRSNASTE
jgi:hypothetical protein